VTSLTGILNGTTNYILDQMGQGQSYAEALREAQRLGFAEADPTLDVGGFDTADKLAILAHLAFGTVVSSRRIPVAGITALTPNVMEDAEHLGYRLKLLGIARREARGLDLRVHPTFIPKQHPLAAVPGAYNAIAVQSESLGLTLCQGAGAGGLPTGSSVVADLIEVGRNLRAGLRTRVLPSQTPDAPGLLPPAQAKSAYYVRLIVHEQPGVLAAVTRIFARHQVSLATVLQRDRTQGPHPVPVVITTHPAPFGAIHKALQQIAKVRSMQAAPQLVPIEELS
jgi:homoserine dehydrogenase